MQHNTPTISNVVLANPNQGSSPDSANMSVGIVVDGRRIYWGDFSSVTRHNNLLDPLPTIERLLDICRSHLTGQHLTHFAVLSAAFKPSFPAAGVVETADRVSAAIEQALLAAVSGEQGKSAMATLATEYMPDIAGRQTQDDSGVPVFLEISDFAATAARIDRLLALRPAGIGYRLTGGPATASLGRNGELLQRFVRDLGPRAQQVTRDETYLPGIYLGLKGALGELTDDPVRHIGKILGNIIGLQAVADPRPLWLEEPLLLNDPVAQPANMRRLRELIERAGDTQKRVVPARLVACASGLEEEEFALHLASNAVSAMTFAPMEGDGISRTADRLARLRSAGLGAFLHLSEAATFRWIQTAVDLALTFNNACISLSFNSGYTAPFDALIRNIQERRVERDSLRNT